MRRLAEGLPPGGGQPQRVPRHGGQARRLHQRRPGEGPDGQVRGRVAVVLGLVGRAVEVAADEDGPDGVDRLADRPPRLVADPDLARLDQPQDRPDLPLGDGGRRALAERDLDAALAPTPPGGRLQRDGLGQVVTRGEADGSGRGDERAEGRVQVGRELPVPRQEQPQRRRALRRAEVREAAVLGPEPLAVHPPHGVVRRLLHGRTGRVVERLVELPHDLLPPHGVGQERDEVQLAGRRLGRDQSAQRPEFVEAEPLIRLAVRQPLPRITSGHAHPRRTADDRTPRPLSHGTGWPPDGHGTVGGIGADRPSAGHRSGARRRPSAGPRAI